MNFWGDYKGGANVLLTLKCYYNKKYCSNVKRGNNKKCISNKKCALIIQSINHSFSQSDIQSIRQSVNQFFFLVMYITIHSSCVCVKKLTA